MLQDFSYTDTQNREKPQSHYLFLRSFSGLGEETGVSGDEGGDWYVWGVFILSGYGIPIWVMK